MNLTPDLLARAVGIAPADAKTWCGPLAEACAKYSINTPARIAAFLAQVAEESRRLTRVTESLNYSAERLAVVFTHYFPGTLASRYEHKPEAIANRVYANRMGNAGEDSGDGYRYRGRGLIQITGKYQYGKCGEALGLDLQAHPELLELPANAAASAAWYWVHNGCNELADRGAFQSITKLINGGLMGYDERLALYRRAMVTLAGA